MSEAGAGKAPRPSGVRKTGSRLNAPCFIMRASMSVLSWPCRRRSGSAAKLLNCVTTVVIMKLACVRDTSFCDRPLQSVPPAM